MIRVVEGTSWSGLLRQWRAQILCNGEVSSTENEGGCGALLIVEAADLALAHEQERHSTTALLAVICPACEQRTTAYANELRIPVLVRERLRPWAGFAPTPPTPPPPVPTNVWDRLNEEP